MKAILAIASLLLIILAGSILLYMQTSSLHRELDRILEELIERVDEEDWPAAREKSDRLEEKWESAEAFWSTFMDHQEINRADESVSRITSLVEMQEKSELYAEIRLTRRLLKSLKEKESPGLQNVF